MSEQETITIDPQGGDLHVVGNEDCDAGWCGREGYPKPCLNCGGWIHAELGEDYGLENEYYYVLTKCDRCGLNEFDAEQAAKNG